MLCKDVQLQIDERLRKGGPDLPNEIRGHIDSCPVCAAYLAELDSLRPVLDMADLRALPGELDDLTFEKIVAAAGGGRKAVRPGRFELRWLWVPLAVAAAIALMILIPRLIVNAPSTVALNTTPGITTIGLINDIALSDSLGDEVLAEMADDMNMDYIAETLSEGSDIDDLLSGLTQSEMEALGDKIDELPTTDRSGKG